MLLQRPGIEKEKGKNSQELQKRVHHWDSDFPSQKLAFKSSKATGTIFIVKNIFSEYLLGGYNKKNEHHYSEVDKRQRMLDRQTDISNL